MQPTTGREQTGKRPTPAPVHRPHLDLIMRDVENPYYNPANPDTNDRVRKVIYNVGESAIEALHHRGAIDDAQKKAAERFRSLWEALGGAGARAIDFTREAVDGGRGAQSLSEGQLTAGLELKACELLLRTRGGDYAYRLVIDICGRGLTIEDVLRAASPPGTTVKRRQRDTMTDMLRMFLDLLGERWGYRKVRSRSAATRSRARILTHVRT